jgi:hypothetical protein
MTLTSEEKKEISRYRLERAERSLSDAEIALHNARMLVEKIKEAIDRIIPQI